MFGIKNFNEKALNNLMEKYLKLEGYGIHVEGTTKEIGLFGTTEKCIFYVSVPEYSSIDITNDKTLNEKYHSGEGLLEYAKEQLILFCFDLIFKVIEEDDDCSEEDIKDFFKFYGKIRKGEMWTEEKGKEAILNYKKILEDKLANLLYKEI